MTDELEKQEKVAQNDDCDDEESVDESECADDDDEYVDIYGDDFDDVKDASGAVCARENAQEGDEEIKDNDSDESDKTDGENKEPEKEEQTKEDKRKTKIDKIKTFFKRVLKVFEDALYPLDCTCDVCGAELVDETRYRLCSDCIENLPFARGHICLNCGVPLKDESDYCNRCQNQKSAFVKNRAPFVYDGEVKRLIYKFKFRKKKYIAQTLGALMADKYLECDMDADIIVFVPMADSEVKKRGFNQAELLANEVGERLNMPVLPALVKIKDTSEQKRLKNNGRAKNLEGAFACIFEHVKDRRVLLVDDIFTTGATANECAKTLLKAKARSVTVLTAAVTRLKVQSE